MKELIQIRKSENLKLRDISLKSGIELSYLSKLFSNKIKDPRIDMLEKVAKAMDCKITLSATKINTLMAQTTIKQPTPISKEEQELSDEDFELRCKMLKEKVREKQEGWR